MPPMPPLVPTVVPACKVDPAHVPVAAASIAARVSLVPGVPGPVVLSQVAVLVVVGVIVETICPQPDEPPAENAHSVRPIGNKQPVGGMVEGGADTAIESAETFRLVRPRNERNDVVNGRVTRQRTTLTRVPSVEGVNVRLKPFHMPRTMSPPAPFPLF